MSKQGWVALISISVCVGFALGWYVEHRRVRNTALVAQGPSNKPRSVQADADCDDAPSDSWHTVRTFSYQPIKTTYMVVWEHCAADIEGRRVRVMDSNFKKVFYEYEDDQILRAEKVELLGNHVPQLLIMTGSAGTDDRVSWHVISEVNGQLHEWTTPDYDAPAEKLLRADEDFCCKEWNFHLREHDIVLAEGIYHKESDGNCCPTRGGVLVSLKPINDGFKLASIRRISKPEYYRWWSQPFCLRCTLAGPG